MMGAEEMRELETSIKENGFKADEPIVLLDGKILDGRNRWKACETVGVKPVTRVFGEDLGADPLSYVLRKNLHRRHLNDSQRAMIAGRLANMRQGARTDKEPRVNSREVGKADAAKQLGVGTSAVEAARKVISKAAPELVRAVDQGRVAVSAAKAIVTLPRRDQVAIANEKDDRERRRMVAAAKDAAKREWAQTPTAPAFDPEAAIERVMEVIRREERSWPDDVSREPLMQALRLHVAYLERGMQAQPRQEHTPRDAAPTSAPAATEQHQKATPSDRETEEKLQAVKRALPLQQQQEIVIYGERVWPQPRPDNTYEQMCAAAWAFRDLANWVEPGASPTSKAISIRRTTRWLGEWLQGMAPATPEAQAVVRQVRGYLALLQRFAFCLESEPEGECRYPFSPK